MLGLADNGIIRARHLVMLLILTIATQSSWAIGEWLHAHGSQRTTVPTTSLNADLFDDGLHEHGRSQPVNVEHDHHHNCFGHNPVAFPADLVAITVTTDAHLQPIHIRRPASAPAEGIDRPNWRLPA